MKWALVVGLFVYGAVVVSAVEHGYRESESEESVDNLLADLERDYLLLRDDEKNVCICKEGEECEIKDDCTCPPTYGITADGKYCRARCDDAEETKQCKNQMECEPKGDNNHFCTCVAGLAGDFCQVITDCGDGKPYEKCVSPEGTCTFDGSKAVCDCADGKKWNKATSKCEDCICGEKQTSCDFDDSGKKVCGCDTNYAQKDGTCTATCDDSEDPKKCQNNMKCDTQGDKPFCTCVAGLAGDFCEIITDCGEGKPYEKCVSPEGTCTFDGKNAGCDCGTGKRWNRVTTKCEDCICGEKETSCDFDDGGKKVCGCDTNYAQKDGTCTACACGDISTGCTFGEGDNKKECECPETHAQKDGVCVATCNVSEETKTCQNKMKCDALGDKHFCTCAEGLTGDFCQVITDCGVGKPYEKCKSPEGTCTFDGKKAGCDCGTEKTWNKTATKCEVCDCGEKQTSCEFNDGGKKVCRCDINYAQKDGTCTACACGDKSTGCTFGENEDKKECKCPETHSQKDGVCVATCDDNEDPKKCKNNMKCDAQGDKHFCSCVAGLTGDFCELITDCGVGKPYEKCKSPEGTCTFDGKNAGCDCGTGKKWNKATTKCEECDCGEKQTSCEFGDGGKKVCECEKNYAQKGGTCAACECGDKSTGCKFGEADGKKECQCPETHVQKEGVCVETCDPTPGENLCENGMKCENRFCTCIKGLTGDLCQDITDCISGKYENCTESGGTCSFHETAAICECDGQKKLNRKAGECQDCICGEGKCSFDPKGSKKCECKPNTAEKDGICQACNCGTESTACEFKKDSKEKVCKCNAKHAQKGDTCTACDCGENSNKCTFVQDKQKCDCKPQFSQKGDTCAECDCGPNGECSFNENELTCKCKEKYAEKKGKCEACDCGNGKCSFDGEGNKQCKCEDKYKEFNKMCKECDCGTGGDCSFDKDGKADCNCNEGYAKKGNKCQKTCNPDNNDCQNGKSCKKIADKVHFCDCGSDKILTGDMCEIVVDCQTGKYMNCVKTGGTCNFVDNNAKCQCSGDKLLDDKLDICRKKCSSSANDCQHGGNCVGNLCSCKEGTSGDNCEVVRDCTEVLNKTCKDAGASCVYDPAGVTKKAKCECDNSDYFEFVSEKCSSIWCNKNKQQCGEKTECAVKDNAAQCKCTEERHYYDYQENKCKKIDSCPLSPCEINEVCENAECKCNDPYVKDKDGKCNRKKLCVAKPCYLGADCTEGDFINTVKCECPSNFFYNPLTSKCEDGVCFLTSNRTHCKTCPSDKFDAEDGNCVPKIVEQRCSKYCGIYGFCLKEGEKETCVCMKTFAKNENEKEKCVLNPDKICASKKTLKDDPLKCNCTGIYKYSANGITCEPKTCGDQEAQSECKSKGRVCLDKESGGRKTGYECKCLEGYLDEKEKGCKDITSCNSAIKEKECTDKQQMCYTNKDGKGECKCPPGYTEKEDQATKQKTCELDVSENEYLLQGLPVLSDKYMKGKTIDTVKLNKDISQSMRTIYKNLEFNYLQNYKISDDKTVIFCDVWLLFKEDALLTIKRWRSETVKLISSLVLPPALLLSADTKIIEKVRDNKLSFCSSIVFQSACGDGTKCTIDSNKINRCSCEKGYKIIGPTVKVIAGNVIMRCADINECEYQTDNCTVDASECVNTQGSFYCRCKPGYQKANPSDGLESQGPCQGLCASKPCQNGGDCKLTEDYKIECKCKEGFRGSFCSEDDVVFQNLKKAQHSTAVVGAVLGTLLGVTFLVIILYILRQRKNSYSEDFAPATRDNAEMVERSRPLRGVSNRGYQ